MPLLMGALGVPDSYEVFITQSENPADPGRPAVVGSMPFIRLEWHRVANDVSTASVKLAPNAHLMQSPLRGPRGTKIPFVPRPWVHALRIHRNGYPVWGGPITSWGRDSDGSLTLNAHDGAIAMRKQVIAVSRNFKDARVTQAVAQIFQDAQLGDDDHSAYPFSVGAFYPLGFYGKSYYLSFTPPPTGAGDAIVTRELTVDRLERIYDVLNEWTSANKFFWTFSTDKLYVNEPGIRQQLESGDGTGWPVLHEGNTVDIPAVNSDAMDIATVIFKPVASTDLFGRKTPVTQYTRRVDATWNTPYSAWMFISRAQPIGTPSGGGGALDLYRQAGLLEGTIQRSWQGSYRFKDINATTLREPTALDLDTNPVDYLGPVHLESTIDADATDVDLMRAWVERSAPKTTVEKVRLQPSFEHPSLAADLSNLLPGCRFIVGWEDKTPFDVPVSEAKVGIGPMTADYPISLITTPNAGSSYPTPSDPAQWDAWWTWDWQMVTCWADSITHLKLMQMDVEVSSDGSGGAIQETVDLSLVPTTQYILNEYAVDTPSLQEYVRPGDGVDTFDTLIQMSTTIKPRPRFVG